VSDNKLPDSQQYLELLQRKLKKVRKDNGVVNQLKQKREEALEHLLVGSDRLNNDYDLELESSTNVIENGVVLEFIRQVRPEQPLCVGEIVHIIKHDQLQEHIENVEEAEK
jgi:Coiled-coil domain containing 32